MGNPVSMLGLEIGRVEKFTMDQENQVVQVEFKINKGIEVYDDAIASIKTAQQRLQDLGQAGSRRIHQAGGV